MSPFQSVGCFRSHCSCVQLVGAAVKWQQAGVVLKQAAIQLLPGPCTSMLHGQHDSSSTAMPHPHCTCLRSPCHRPAQCTQAPWPHAHLSPHVALTLHCSTSCCPGMDFYVVLERPGYRVTRRRRCKTRVGVQHKVTKEDAIKW